MSTRKTISFTGMDSSESAGLKVLFAEANRRAGDLWSIGNDDDADMLVVDVDSMYGHMTWLRVHNSGRDVVALSSSPKADADYRLLRPVTVDSLTRLLTEHAAGPAVPMARPGAAAAEPALPAAAQTAPAAPRPTPAPTAAPMAAPTPEPVAASAPPPEPVGPPSRDPMLGDYLKAGALPGPVKLKRGDAPLLVLDPQTQSYLGPAALKGFLPYGKEVIREDAWTAVTPHELERLKAELGGAQPWARLAWLAGLVASDGHLAPGYDPNLKYRLLKWPQIEREFPKHFRIATAMMKGPQLLTEIAEGSGATLGEVTDFVNANLAIGQAEMEVPPPPADPNAAAKSGLLGRLRGR